MAVRRAIRRTVSRREHRPATRRGARTRFGTVAALLVALALVAALAAACSAEATMGAAGSGSPAPGGASSASPGGAATDAGAKAGAGADWSHTLQVVANLRAAPPTDPVVVLLGGSAARESTISDGSWRAQIEAKGGPATAAYNLGSRNRTLAQNVALVKALPRVPTIVFIGVNLGAFTSAQRTATITLPEPLTPLPSYDQHVYTRSDILSVAKKKALVRAWLAERYPVYRRNFTTSAGVLATLIKVCQTRGMKPVLFELPRNTAIIGSSLSAPTARYRDRCRKLAAYYHIPYVNLVSQAGLPNSSFYDLWHLVEPGREVWQDLLSARTATLLERYGYGGGS